MAPRYFATPSDFRRWLAKHHASAAELLVGFHKVGSGRPSMSWSESVDEALCAGWIDGVRRSLGEQAYTIRFSPRRPGSIWSAINIRKAEALIAEGRMLPAGLKAFRARTERKSLVYSYEQGEVELPDPYAAILKKNKQAWTFFHAQPPGYRQQMSWRVISAKQEATRRKRLDKLIEASAKGLRLS
jgi:uncharacterized protein YdeI (YjbR/CyaY-like superfamily)